MRIGGNDVKKIGFTRAQLAMQISCAAADGFLESVRRAIQRGADMNSVVDRSKRTPLMLAADGNHPDVVEFLLKKGADPHVQDSDGRNAFQYARQLVGSAARIHTLLRVAMSNRVGNKWKDYDMQPSIYLLMQMEFTWGVFTSLELAREGAEKVFEWYKRELPLAGRKVAKAELRHDSVPEKNKYLKIKRWHSKGYIIDDKKVKRWILFQIDESKLNQMPMDERNG